MRHNGLLCPYYASCIMHDKWLRDRRVQVNGAHSVRDNYKGRKWEKGKRVLILQGCYL